jgi:signal transduction histidine kinase
MQELSEKAGHQMRTLLFELRPLVLETQGLPAALQVFLDRRQKDIESITTLSLRIKTDDPKGRLSRQDDKVEAAIFAIVQETVNNAIKHAQAKNIVVELQETATAQYVVIADDGNGFDVEAVMARYENRGSMGMLNIKERTELIGGELTIKSFPGKGSRFTVYLPKDETVRLKKRGRTGPLSMRLDRLPKE